MPVGLGVTQRSRPPAQGCRAQSRFKQDFECSVFFLISLVYSFVVTIYHKLGA